MEITKKFYENQINRKQKIESFNNRKKTNEKGNDMRVHSVDLNLDENVDVNPIEEGKKITYLLENLSCRS
jgi:hypothetical protein